MRWNDRIGRRIKLSDLHILIAVVQTGSMAKAAAQLAVSHPVISRSISDLERTLGVRLLERNPRGVEVTAYGRAILARSHAAFDALRQGVRDIEFLSDPTVGEVRIGTTPPLAASVDRH
jgi:DNA-binding transcriptional LysR family regulator